MKDKWIEFDATKLNSDPDPQNLIIMLPFWKSYLIDYRILDNPVYQL